jgi:1,4-dihydroxy-2-naphthoyl-CoA hydrolase
MSIWFKPYQLTDIAWMSKGNMVEHIGIEITNIGENTLEGKMPVDHRTKQPTNILHGGASVALAESLGSLAANLVVNPEKFLCVGLEINANHLRPVSKGFVYGVAKPVHIGRTTQVWNIEISNEDGKVVCISRITMAVTKRS